MKRNVIISFLALLLLVPAGNVQAQYRKKKQTTDIIKEGTNKRLWLRSKSDTSWVPTEGGLYEQVTRPELSGKKGKKVDPIIDPNGKHKVRETAYDTVFKFAAFDAKRLYYVDYNYNDFRALKWLKDKDRNWGTFDPVMDHLTSAGRIPMQICAVFAVNPNVTDPDRRRELIHDAQMEAVISLDFLRDVFLELELRNKIAYQVAEIDWRYWKDEAYYNEPQPDDELIHVGLILGFSSKKADLFPSPAKDAPAFANIKFFPNDATIQESYLPEVENLAKTLKERDGLEVLLTGYSDNTGTESYNRGLAHQRCVEIKKALVLRGIEEHRIEIIAKGEEDPVADNSTYSGRLDNNRVTVKLQ